jgi:hypothetical protein
LLPIHALFNVWESPDEVHGKTKVQKMKEHQKLIRLMLHHYPESALVPCKTYRSLLELISSRKIEETNESMHADENLVDREAVEKLDWEIRMMILEVAHKVYREKNGQSASPTFHPICAAVELLSSEDNFSMLDRVLEDITWCHSLEMIEAMYTDPDDFKRYGPKKNILEERRLLKMMIFCNRRDMYFSLLNRFPLGCLSNELEYAFRMGRYYMIEQVVKKYSDMACVPDDNGKLPVDLVESLLHKRSDCYHFEYMFNILQEDIGLTNRRRFVSPKQSILNLLRLNMRLKLVPTYILTDSDIDTISKGQKLKIGSGEFVFDQECSTCLESYKSGDKVSWATGETSSCVHGFHRDCIVRWLSSKEEATCPTCRQSFLPCAEDEGTTRPNEYDVSTGRRAGART